LFGDIVGRFFLKGDTLRRACKFLAVCCLPWWGVEAWANERVLLREAVAPGYQYHVSCRVQLSGKLTLPATKAKDAPAAIEITGHSAIEYDERVLELDKDSNVSKAIRSYSRMEFERKVGSEVQQNSLRPEARKLVLLRLKQVEVPFSPTAPLTWGEIDMVRTDVFTPALAGLLTQRPVRPGDRWLASQAAAQELTDLESIEEGELECRLESVSLVGKRRHARVAFSGRLRGLGEDGPTRHHLDGFVLFDLESSHLSYLSMKGIQSMLDKDSESGKIEGTFVLTRQPQQTIADLSDAALRGLTLEPNDDNTQLLYDNPELGLRFLYPRRWRVAGAKGRQLGLDETRGSGGLLMTIENLKRVPSGAQYLDESRSWLTQQKVTIVRSDPPRTLQGSPNHLEHFVIDSFINKQSVRLAYYVIRQPQGGVTLAARLLSRDMAALEADVQRIARSIQVTKQQ
jgi:hypothetical protein